MGPLPQMQIEFGALQPEPHQRREQGLRLQRSKLAVSEVLHSVEGCPPPDQLIECHPDITQEEWDAVMRMATMVFLALDRPFDES